MEWVEKNTLKWFGHVGRMGSGKFVKKVYESDSEGPNRRGRPFGRCKDSVEEYLESQEERRKGLSSSKFMTFLTLPLRLARISPL